eukprot:4770657-Pyramimonas_sp.AAC.1
MVREFGMGNMATRTIVSYISALPDGGAPVNFGCVPCRKNTPLYRIHRAIAVRLAKSVQTLSSFLGAGRTTLIHSDSGPQPGDHLYETTNASRQQPCSTDA